MKKLEDIKLSTEMLDADGIYELFSRVKVYPLSGRIYTRDSSLVEIFRDIVSALGGSLQMDMEPDPVLTSDPDPVLTSDPEPILTSDPDPILTSDPDPVLTSDIDPELYGFVDLSKDEEFQETLRQLESVVYDYDPDFLQTIVQAMDDYVEDCILSGFQENG